MSSNVDKLLRKNEKLNQLDGAKVVSHVQRESDGWVVNLSLIHI